MIAGLQEAMRKFPRRSSWMFEGQTHAGMKDLGRLNGGGRGIRTPGTLSGTTVFKTAGINHSPIPPQSGKVLVP